MFVIWLVMTCVSVVVVAVFKFYFGSGWDSHMRWLGKFELKP